MFFSLSTPTLLLSLLPLLLGGAQATHHCSTKFSELARAKNIHKCQKLNTLGVEFGWTTPISNNGYTSAHVIFGAAVDDEKGWLAWGVNPGGLPQMVGTRAAIGIKKPDGSGFCRTYNVTTETRMGCRLRPAEMEEVKCVNFEYNDSMDYYVVYARLNLSEGEYEARKLNIVWQRGFEVEGDEPKKHGVRLRNVDSIETLNLFNGTSSSVAELRIHLRKWHGILNIIGWGTLLPLGVIIARYFRKFPFKCKTIWFYVHVSCQLVGYGLGVVGWGIGLWLGHVSTHYVFLCHRVLAMLIFSLVTLQVFALWLRPASDDAFRKLWDIYHHFLGYALVALIVTNIFQGIGILKPANKTWKWAYVGILIALASITLILEYYTWKCFIHLRRKCREQTPPPPPLEDSVANRP